MSGANPIFTQFPIINSVFQNPTKGIFFSGRSNENAFTCVLHKSHFGFCQISGEGGFKLFLNEILNNAAIPDYFHLYEFDLNSRQMELLNEHGIKYKIRKRNRYRFLNSPGSTFSSSIELKPLTDISQQEFEKLGFNGYLNFWDDFVELKESGYGVVAFLDKQPIGICYSAAFDHEASEIDIFTKNEFRSKGTAKLLTEEYVRISNQKKLVAQWDCFESNLASVKVAENVGFRLIKSYSFVSLFNPKRSELIN